MFGLPKTSSSKRMRRSYNIVSLCHMLLWTALLYGAGCGGVHAQLDVNVDDMKVTVHAQEVPLVNVLQAIGEQAGMATVVRGGSNVRITTSFLRVPLLEAVRRLTGNAAIVLLYNGNSETEGKARRPTELRVYIGGERTPVRSAGESIPRVTTVADRASEVRQAVAGPGARVPEVTPRLPVDDTDISDVLRLAERADSASIEKLGRTLAEHEDLGTCRLIVSLLSEIGGDRVVPALESGLGKADSAFRGYLVETLGALESEDATRSLGQVLFGERDPNIRLLAVGSLANRGDEPARAFLEAATQDSNRQVRRAAERALAGWP